MILFVPTWVLIIYKTNIITSVNEDVEKLAASLAASKLVMPLRKKIWQFLKQVLCDLAVLFRGSFVRAMMCTQHTPSSYRMHEQCGLALQWNTFSDTETECWLVLQRGWPLTITPRPRCGTPCIWNLQSRWTVDLKGDSWLSKAVMESGGEGWVW